LTPPTVTATLAAWPKSSREARLSTTYRRWRRPPLGDIGQPLRYIESEPLPSTEQVPEILPEPTTEPAEQPEKELEPA
jgi:hypothetical protein